MTRVLVTGADGFIGSHLVEVLVSQGHDVRALALYNSFGRIGWLEESPVRDDVEVVLGDIRDASICRELTAGVDVVFHLAALIGIPYSYRAVQSYLDTNVQGTQNMCSAALESGVSQYVQMSTSEVYGTARRVPIDEEHPLQPQSPYSASKIAADALARSYQASFELPVTIARAFNTYGPRQSRRAFIPTVITQVLADSDSILIGDVRPTRDLTFVRETALALTSLMGAAPGQGETLNIGTGNEHSVGEVIALIQDLMGSSKPLVTDPARLRPAGSEVFRLVCDNRRLRETTGSAPSTDIRQGLEATIAWFTAPERRHLLGQTDYAT
jgi:NAD dependent epimerase/dehydratase